MPVDVDNVVTTIPLYQYGTLSAEVTIVHDVNEVRITVEVFDHDPAVIVTVI